MTATAVKRPKAVEVYLALEKAADLLERYIEDPVAWCSPDVETIRDVMDAIWFKIATEDRNLLNAREVT